MALKGKQLIPIAVAVVALVAGLGIGSVSFPTTTTTTKTVTTPAGAPRLYEVEFAQQGVCSPEVWLAPWAVTLNNQTVVRPSNATLPLSENSFGAGASGENYSVIAFSVPDGTYSYIVYPQSFLGQTGNVTVDGSDVLITVHGAPVSCTTSTSPTATTTTTTNSTTQTATAIVCYGGNLPANNTSPAPSRTTFNVTREFDSWVWSPLSSFEVGSYSFQVSVPQSSLEPELFITVNNNLGMAEMFTVTNLGNWNGQSWPPDLLGYNQTLFGGAVTIQFLFPCGNQDVYLEVTTG